jgi:photosystem II stability/assembly factor-like uncharacterized protein
MRKSRNGLYAAGFLLAACVVLLTCGVSAGASGSKSTGSSTTTYSWTPHVFPGTCQWIAVASSEDGTKLIAAVEYGYIYTSTDSGATWTQQIGTGQNYWTAVTSSSDGTKLVAADNGYDSGGYIYTSSDSGATWTQQTGAGQLWWSAVASSSDGKKLVAVDEFGSSGAGGYLYTSTDSGATWTQQTGAGQRSWFAVASSSDGTKLVAAPLGGYIYTSSDSGATWTQQTGAGQYYWRAVASSSDGTKLVATKTGCDYIHTSTDSGATWTQQTGAGQYYWQAVASSSDGTKLAATEEGQTGSGGYVHTSFDSGATWTQHTSAGQRSWLAVASSTDGTKLIAADYVGYIYTSSDSGGTWTQQTSPGNHSWGSVASSSDGKKLVAADLLGDMGSGGYIYTSTDSGATWTQQTGAGQYYWRAVASSSDGTKLVAAASGDHIYTSSDSGATWTQQTGAGQCSWFAVASSSDGTKLAAAEEGQTGYDGYIHTSSDSGATWTQQTAAGQGGWIAVASSSDGTKLVATKAGWDYIYTSTDSGGTWTQQTGAGSQEWTAIASSSDGTKLIAADDGGCIYTSTDSGATWTQQTGAGPRFWSAVASSSDGTKLVAADGYDPLTGSRGYIYTSSDSGATWTQQTGAGACSWTALASSADATKIIAAAQGCLLTGSAATSPSIDTPISSAITTSTATLGATIESKGGSTVTAAGVAYGTNPSPDTTGSTASTTAASGLFTVNVTGLTPNTLYHFRGYATNSQGTSYTADATFTTLPDAPTATAATRISASGFTANWTASTAGTETITGYQLDVAANSGFSSFVSGYNGLAVSGTSAPVTGLTPGNTYYYRVRAVNAKGAGANSNTETVLFAIPPSIGTPTSSAVTTTTAQLGAAIVSTGGASITAAGVAYGTNQNPDTTGSTASTTARSGAFTVNVTGLTSNTLYHFRGYATNAQGTGYTADTTFTTFPGAPTATAASGMSASGFTANWTAPTTGTATISGYQLDVANDSGFKSFVSGYNNLSVSGTSSPVTGLTSGNTYYYRVRAVNAGGTSAGSNSEKVVFTPPPTLSVTYPTGGETFAQGGKYTITWSYTNNPGSNVKIELLSGGSSLGTITSSTSIGKAGAGSYSWTVPSSQAQGKDYKVRVTSTSNSSCTASSPHSFTVTGPSISITSPRGGNWNAGSKCTISWTYAGNPGSSVSIALLQAGSKVSTITSTTSAGSNGKGSYAWIIPATQGSGANYQVQVSSTTMSSCTATTGYFTIVGPSISVTSPSGGSFNAGSKCLIAWTYTGSPGTVRIDLWKGGSKASTIVSSTSVGSNNKGSYSWTIPKTQAAGTDYSISVTSTSNSSIYGAGSFFAITGSKASAGPDQKAIERSAVKLSGSNSVSSNKIGASCLWTQLDGPPVEIANPSAVETGFVAPYAGPEGKSLRFQLTVTLADGTSSQDECIVDVVKGSALPTADAGPTQTVAASQIVELDGSGSSAPDGESLAYFWRQVSGIAVSLSDPSAAKPTFVAPDAASSGESLAFELTVTDQTGLRSRDTCIVNVVSDNLPPTALAGPNQTVSPGSRVVLDGSGSTDEDGGILSYAWKQIAGVPVTLSDPTAVKPVFVAPSVDGQRDLVFELTVTNAAGLQDKAKVVIAVFGVSN